MTSVSTEDFPPPRAIGEIYDDLAQVEQRLQAAHGACREAAREEAEAQRAAQELKGELNRRNKADVRARMNGGS